MAFSAPVQRLGYVVFFLSSFILFHITPGFEVQRKATLNVPFFFFFSLNLPLS